MNPTNYSSLVDFVQPAIILAIVAYLTHLFGKVIADQNPFTDDRKWTIEIAGITFMIILAQGVVGVGAALYGPHPFSYQTMHIADILLVGLIYGIIVLGNAALGAKFFKIGFPIFKTETAKKYDLQNVFYMIGKYLPVSLVPIVLFYIGTIEYLSKSLIWMILIGSSIFYILIHLAMNFSMRKMWDRTAVDIHFVDNTREPYRDVAILKVNDDNIRLRAENVIIILNKSEVLKIEMVIPERQREILP